MNILLLSSVILYLFSAINSVSESKRGNCTEIEDYYYMVPYKNYNDTVIIFPESINDCEKTYTFSDDIFLSWENLKNLKLPEREVSDSLLTILFSQDLINEWPYYDSSEKDSIIVSDVIIPDDLEFFYKNKGDYLEKERPNFKIYLLGNIKINKKFSSTLILSLYKKEERYIRNVFLLNMVNNRLKSITNFIYYHSLGCGCSYKNIQLLNNRIFSMYGSVVILKNIEDYYPVSEIYPKFYYDDEGYLIVLE